MSIKEMDLSSLTRKNSVNSIVLLCIGLTLFIPYLGRVHLFDWDEANFAEAAREMIVSQNYLQVTINYEPFYEKPPLFIWLQVLSMKVFGINEFAARFVNALFGILTLLSVYLIGRRFYNNQLGMLWALSFAGSFLPHLFFKSGIIDPVFNLFIFLGLASIITAILTETPRHRLLLFVLAGASIGLATLAKGPVAFLLISLVMFAYWATRRFKVFFKATDIIGFMVAMIAVVSVFFGIETFHHGTVFIREFIAYQIRLFSTGDAGHGRPFYFHTVVILFGCFPASFFAIVSFFRRTETTEPQIIFNRFMVILFWVVLILFSIVKTKTVLYSSLTYFPVTYLCALSLHGLIKGTIAFKRPLFIALAVFAGLVGIAITLFPILIINKQWIIPFIRDKFAIACLENPVVWSGWEFLLGMCYMAAVGIALWFMKSQRFVNGTIVLFGSSAVCLFLFMFIFAPKIESYSQGGPIAFYKKYADEEVYVRSIFKSYTDLFYSKKRLSDNPESRKKEWLLTGPIDKPAYFVARTTQAKRYRDTTLGFRVIGDEYGFVYFMRDVK